MGRRRTTRANQRGRRSRLRSRGRNGHRGAPRGARTRGARASTEEYEALARVINARAPVARRRAARRAHDARARSNARGLRGRAGRDIARRHRAPDARSTIFRPCSRRSRRVRGGRSSRARGVSGARRSRLPSRSCGGSPVPSDARGALRPRGGESALAEAARVPRADRGSTSPGACLPPRAWLPTRFLYRARTAIQRVASSSLAARRRRAAACAVHDHGRRAGRRDQSPLKDRRRLPIGASSREGAPLAWSHSTPRAARWCSGGRKKRATR